MYLGMHRLPITNMKTSFTVKLEFRSGNIEHSKTYVLEAPVQFLQTYF